ncbi:isochorismatase family protein [Kineococcus rhizosphaerae]|uniref:Maleamate amidohydrolase n=1 Tax=Kineococcus rhizosphaerae TaxID=559628 RepID=A0A2T0R728_9ACTN|nr:isochorismatase family protein [Kineococcus rhizosphaerae]PRY16974.1 maleamate amidohydrolase [Kineococcus rhizosphaerae]
MSVDDYAGAGFGAGLTPGARPALLLVDPARAYTDPGSFLYAGPAAVRAAEAMRALMAAARAAGIPVVVTRVAIAADGADAGVFFRKVPGLRAFGPGSPLAEYVEGLAPQEGDVEVVKQYPSAYFGTDLVARLRERGVDTVLIGGFSTSGCVRASTLDTLQNGFVPLVVTDACGDRDASVQAANLFDMGQKMAELWSLDTASRYLAGVSVP